MYKKISLIIVGLILIAGLVFAISEDLTSYERYEYYKGSNDGAAAVDENSWYGNSFHVGGRGDNTAFLPKGFSFFGSLGNGDPGPCYVYIDKLNATSDPQGDYLANSTFNPTDLGGVDVWHNITFNYSSVLLPDTSYLYFIKCASGTYSGDYIWVRYDDTSPAYNHGGFFRTQDSGSTWDIKNGSTNDFLFEIYGSQAGVTTILEYPSNSGVIATDTEYFNTSITGTSLQNVTTYVWYSNGTLADSDYVNISGPSNSSSIPLTNFSVGSHKWNSYACGGNGQGINCSWATSNYTFEWVPFSEDQESSEGNVLETSYQTFYLNITVASGYDVQDVSLNYNGTTYTGATKNTIDSDSYELIKSIYIPAGNTGFGSITKNYKWNLEVVNEATGDSTVVSSSTYTQNVRELTFGLCSSSLNIPMLNFTMIDENSGSQINGANNATTFEATFDFGADVNSLIKNYSISNLSTSLSEWDFCTDNSSNIIYSDMESFYTAQGYTEKHYYLNDAQLTNNTNEINLYVLPSGEALEFFISVTRNLDALSGVAINIDKFFVGEGIYKTVEIDETDVDGEITAYLDLDKKYKFTIIEDGEVISIQEKRATCEEAPCEIDLSITGDGTDVINSMEDYFGTGVVYNLNYDSSTKIVTFDFVDTTGLADYFRLYVYRSRSNESRQTIYDKTLYTTSGTITFNASNYTDGNFLAEAYISRSPEKLIDFITFLLSSTVETLGLLGLFVALILVGTIIFGFSFKPAMLIMAVPLSLTLMNLMGFVALGATTILLFYLLAIIAVAVVSR